MVFFHDGSTSRPSCMAPKNCFSVSSTTNRNFGGTCKELKFKLALLYVAWFHNFDFEILLHYMPKCTCFENGTVKFATNDFFGTFDTFEWANMGPYLNMIISIIVQIQISVQFGFVINPQFFFRMNTFGQSLAGEFFDLDVKQKASDGKASSTFELLMMINPREELRKEKERLTILFSTSFMATVAGYSKKKIYLENCILKPVRAFLWFPEEREGKFMCMVSLYFLLPEEDEREREKEEIMHGFLSYASSPCDPEIMNILALTRQVVLDKEKSANFHPWVADRAIK
uniref:Uncharacterized protein n=1 Tax=Romanomermis culicivorax TaxID=13658 RepID=A0A915HRA3_ROMCU